MATRKPKNAPKGIDDQIIGGIRAIMSPWLGTPPAQNKSVTQAQGLARGAAQTLDQTFAGGMIGAGVKGNKALAQQAAVNVAALGAGYIAGKAMQTAAGAVVKSGVPAQIINKATKSTVIVHGSPVSGLKEIQPRFPTTSKTKVPRVYGIRTDIPFDDVNKTIVSKYAKGTFYGPNMNPPKQGGSIYVLRTPLATTDLSAEQLRYGVVATSTTSKGRVMSEINNVSQKTKEEISTKLDQALKRAGVKLPKKR
jgi:hypothetical protein